METPAMKVNITRQHLIKEVQEVFNNAYPFLKIEFIKKVGESPEKPSLKASSDKPSPEEKPSPEKPSVEKPSPEKPLLEMPSPEKTTGMGGNSGVEENIRTIANNLLWDGFGLTADMKVSELEILLQYQFGLPVLILRKSGNVWIETRMTQHWTLRQQNDHGQDIALTFK